MVPVNSPSYKLGIPVEMTIGNLSGSCICSATVQYPSVRVYRIFQLQRVRACNRSSRTIHFEATNSASLASHELRNQHFHKLLCNVNINLSIYGASISPYNNMCSHWNLFSIMRFQEKVRRFSTRTLSVSHTASVAVSLLLCCPDSSSYT